MSTNDNCEETTCKHWNKNAEEHCSAATAEEMTAVGCPAMAMAKELIQRTRGKKEARVITKEEYAARPRTIDEVFKYMTDNGATRIDMTVGMKRPSSDSKPVTVPEIELQVNPSLVVVGEMHLDPKVPGFQDPWWMRTSSQKLYTECMTLAFKIWLCDLPEVMWHLQQEGYETIVDKRDEWHSARSKCQYAIDKAAEKIQAEFAPDITRARIEVDEAVTVFTNNMKKRSAAAVNVTFRS